MAPLSIVLFACLLMQIESKNYEMVLISGLNNHFDFDHNLFLFNDSRIDLKAFINGEDSTPRTIWMLETSSNKERSSYLPLHSIYRKMKNQFVVVVITNCKFDKNATILDHVRRLKQGMKIGFLFPYCGSIEDIQQLFEWCKANVIVNVFATLYLRTTEKFSNETIFSVFTYNLFGPFKIVDLTHSKYEAYFTNTKSDYKRQEIQRFNAGTDAIILWPATLNIREIYIERVPINSSTGSVWNQEFGFQNLFGSRYTLNGFSFGTGINYAFDISMSPITVLPQVIVVPQSLPYADFTVYLQSLMSGEFFGYSMITVAVTIVILVVVRFIKWKKLSLIETLVDVSNLVINDNGNIRYQRLSLVECYIIVPLTFIGLVFVNGILSNLQSYVTQPVYENQMNSIEDIYRSDLPIFVFWDGWRNELIKELQEQTQFQNWNDKIVLVEDDELGRKISSFERVGFVTSVTAANFLINTQKRLGIRGYHHTRVQVGHLFPGYAIGTGFLYSERLSEILLTIQRSGLYEQWHRQHLADYEKIIIRKYLQRLRSQRENSSLDFPLMIVYGWVAGSIALIIEIFWKRLAAFNVLGRTA